MVSLSADEIMLFADPAEYQGIEGTVCLTNKKITFDYEQRGIFFIGQHSALTLPLESISSISVVGIGKFKRLVINVVSDFGSFDTPTHEFKMENPENWKERIELAKGRIELNINFGSSGEREKRNRTSGQYAEFISNKNFLAVCTRGVRLPCLKTVRI